VAFEKYKKLFAGDTSAPGTVMTDWMRAKRAFQACKLFDPLYLATDQPMEVLHALADNLEVFADPEMVAPYYVQLTSYKALG
jgi:hypothetical protein